MRRSERSLAGLSSGSYEVFLPLGIAAAVLLSRTIDKVLQWYLQILEIRKKRLDLQNLGAPVAETNAVKKYERDLLDKEIHDLAKGLIAEVQPKLAANRKNELETQLTISIRQIARFVDKGGDVEIDSTPVEEPAEPPAPPPDTDPASDTSREYERMKEESTHLKLEYERVSKIIEAGSSLRRLPLRPEPILQLADGETEIEALEEKTSKKKT